MQKGFSLMEVILSVAMFTLIATPVIVALLHAQESIAYAGAVQRANFLAEEGIEAVRNIRDQAFSNLSNGTYGLSLVNNEWTLSGSSDTTEVFTRTVEVGAVSSTIKGVTSTVQFNYGRARQGSVSVSSLLSNWLAVGVSWATASLESSFDLTVANSGNNNADAISIAVASNYVYLGRSSGSGKELSAFDVSIPASPLLVGSVDLNGDPSDMVIRGNYLYIASTDNSEELQIVNISDPATINQAGKVTTVNLTNANSGSNNANALKLAVSGSYLYMLRNGGDQFLIFDLTNASSPGNPVGRSSALTGTPTDIGVSGNYAYISGDDNSNEIQIFDNTVKTAPSRVATVDINSGSNNPDANAVFIAGTYLLVGRAANGSSPELYSYSLTNPIAPSLASTVEIGDNVERIVYESVAGTIFCIVNDSNNDIQMIDGSNLASLPAPPPLATVNINDDPQHFVYDSTLDRLFIASSDNSQELQVLKSN